MNAGREERGAYALLAGVPGVGPKRISLLVEAFGSASEAIRARPSLVAALPGFGPDVVAAVCEARRNRHPEEVLQGAERQGVTIVLREDAEYPRALRHIYNPPQVLFVRGSVSAMDAPVVAVVGARNCSERGRWVAERLAEGLSEAGICVVSGLARGIDSAAHRGALRKGRTVAVVGNGVDVVYPACNRVLATEVERSGALVSEYPLGTKPCPGHFPARNRIISGLALGTVVVEAGERSGAMITAAFAVQQDREVFAVPGDTRAPGCRGPHRLIKEGAKLVETVADILEEFRHLGLPQGKSGGIRGSGVATRRPGASEGSALAVLDLLADGPCTLDEIAERLGCGVPEAATALTILELDGLVSLRPGAKYATC